MLVNMISKRGFYLQLSFAIYFNGFLFCNALRTRSLIKVYTCIPPVCLSVRLSVPVL